MYFTTLQLVILIKWLYLTYVSDILTPCTSGDSREVAVLENGGTGD